MDFTKIRPFLEQTAATSSLPLKKKANYLLDDVLAAQQHEQVVDPQVTAKGEKAVNETNAPKDEIDSLIESSFPDLVKPEPSVSTFGKSASAYVNDVELSSLPKGTLEDISKLLPDASKKAKVVQYGMVVEELLPKVDTHNFSVAEKHIDEKFTKNGKKDMGDEFQSKIGSKYILLLNDQIIDGHHFLALAKKLGITCSLKVLDLTPIRFQEKRASLIDNIRVKKYGSNNHSWPGSFTTSRYTRS